ncbi:hypothetical protein E3226_000500 [Legionella geestiana]|uniref:hypothetical protein n=1 Tax=Legionella geestiana TaxID=45065 RepID=UPI001091AD5C|nr:hypothetical protein [Legionella geestiana]QDQ38990.1 hypothetical protein E3226_000500 [Legionella geestiana]
MKTIKGITTSLGMVSLIMMGFGSVAHAEESVGGLCAPLVWPAVQYPGGPYKNLFDTLSPKVSALGEKVESMVSAPTVLAKEARYDELVAFIEATFPDIGISPRLLLAESDGTVIYDSSQAGKSVVNADSSCGALGVVARNSYASFCTKQVNENHNTRIDMLNAQLWPCATGIETKFSTSVGVFQSYVGIRMGAYLNNNGTARYSQNRAS